jgi:hypothetical protein
VKVATIEHLDLPVTMWEPDAAPAWNHNPTICRDDKDEVWIGVRHHDLLPLTVHLDPQNPNADEASRFMVGKLDEKTLEVTGLRLIVPEPGSPDFLLKHSTEDVRIFWRYDGLHGIGVIFTPQGITQGEILINYDQGTYKLLQDYGQPYKHTEKNWSPPINTTEAFDFVYSQSEVVKYGRPRKSENIYKGEIHGGSQLLPYKEGWISIAHRVNPVVGLTWRWYATVARLHDYNGKVTHISQFFDFGSGWRENLQESVEYVSGAIWAKPDEELLLSLGVRDETCGFVRLPIKLLKWQEPGGYYHKFELDESLKKIVKEHAGQKPFQGFLL